MNYKIIFLSTIMFIIILFSGCSSNVSVGLNVMPDGSVVQSYSVNFDKQELSQLYSDEEIDTIYEVTKTYINDYLKTTLLSVKEFAFENGYNEISWALNPPVKCELSESKDTLQIKGNIIFIDVNFYRSYNKYLSGDEGTDTETTSNTTIEGLFYDKIIFMESTNPVANSDTLNSVYTQIQQRLSIKGIDFTFDVNDATVYYDYAVPYSDAQVNRIKSNADKEYLTSETNANNGDSYIMKHFVWKYNSDGDNTITLYGYKINSVAWYLTALIMVVIFGLILLVIYFTKKKLNKVKIDNGTNKNDDVNNEIKIN